MLFIYYLYIKYSSCYNHFSYGSKWYYYNFRYNFNSYSYINRTFYTPILKERRRKHLTGETGENIVIEILNELKLEDEVIINNYLASRNKDKTFSIEIDHIFITDKGIFVIETKDYKGRLYGSREQNYWTQVLAYGEVKNKIYNPIKQNETHCNYVQKLLNYKYHVNNIVIFIDTDISQIQDSFDIISNINYFKDWYKHIHTHVSLESSDIKYISQILLNEINNMPITIEEHKRHIERWYKEKY